MNKQEIEKEIEKKRPFCYGDLTEEKKIEWSCLLAKLQQRIDDEKEINKLIEEKQMIIRKEGYPASDVIAVLRREIKEEFKEEILDLENWLDICSYKRIANQDYWDLKKGIREQLEELLSKIEKKEEKQDD